MYIISCILSITKMSKQELAEFVSITEDMIDEYLNGEEIKHLRKIKFETDTEKNIIPSLEITKDFLRKIF